MKEKTHKIMNLRIIILLLASIALSLVILFIANTQIIENLPYKWISILLETIATTLMVAGTIGLFFRFITMREIITCVDRATTTIERHFKIFRGISEAGLYDMCYDHKDFSFDEILLSSKRFRVVMNDGRRWVGENSESLRKRMLIPNYETTFIFQHPQSEMIPLLAKKTKHSPNYICEKIQDTIRELLSFERDCNHKLRIYGHHLFNVYALFVSEEFAAFTPYYISFGRRTVPIFVYQRLKTKSQYDLLSKDIDELLNIAEDLLPETDSK